MAEGDVEGSSTEMRGGSSHEPERDAAPRIGQPFSFSEGGGSHKPERQAAESRQQFSLNDNHPPPHKSDRGIVPRRQYALNDKDRRYHVIEAIGKGSYGIVYRANALWNNEMVAIKHISDILSSGVIDLKRSLRELSILRQSSHPSIIDIRTIIQPISFKEALSIDVVFPYVCHDLQHVIKHHRRITGWGADFSSHGNAKVLNNEVRF